MTAREKTKRFRTYIFIGTFHLILMWGITPSSLGTLFLNTLYKILLIFTYSEDCMGGSPGINNTIISNKRVFIGWFSFIVIWNWQFGDLFCFFRVQKGQACSIFPSCLIFPINTLLLETILFLDCLPFNS